LPKEKKKKNRIAVQGTWKGNIGRGGKKIQVKNFGKVPKPKESKKKKKRCCKNPRRGGRRNSTGRKLGGFTKKKEINRNQKVVEGDR